MAADGQGLEELEAQWDAFYERFAEMMENRDNLMHLASVVERVEFEGDKLALHLNWRLQGIFDTAMIEKLIRESQDPGGTDG
jgi:hypothetical protein